jgi:hypothetical protein
VGPRACLDAVEKIETSVSAGSNNYISFNLLIYLLAYSTDQRPISMSEERNKTLI